VESDETAGKSSPESKKRESARLGIVVDSVGYSAKRNRIKRAPGTKHRLELQGGGKRGQSPQLIEFGGRGEPEEKGGKSGWRRTHSEACNSKQMGEGEGFWLLGSVAKGRMKGEQGFRLYKLSLGARLVRVYWIALGGKGDLRDLSFAPRELGRLRQKKAPYCRAIDRLAVWVLKEEGGGEHVY